MRQHTISPNHICLYYFPETRAQRVGWALEELGLAYRAIYVDVA